MGAGKSTIGRSLASKLEMEHVDLDCYIQEAENMTVGDIFAAHGEEYFRDLETKYLAEVVTKDNLVLSTGGGTPCWGNNMETLKNHGVTIYLKCSPEMLTDRLLHSKNKRPLIEGKSEDELKKYVTEMIEKREEYYNQASVIISNPSRDVTQILEILSYYK